MKTAYQFKLYTTTDQLLRWFWVAMFAVFCSVLCWTFMMTRVYDVQIGLGVYKLWTFLTCLFAATTAWRSATLIAVGNQAFSGICAPARLWRAWKQRVVIHLLGPTAVVGGLSLLLFGLEGSPWPWYTGAAAVFVACVGGLTVGLHSHGLLSWSRNRGMQIARSDAPRASWRRRFVLQVRRFRPLEHTNLVSPRDAALQPDGWVMRYLLPVTPMMYLPLWVGSFSWGDPITLLHLLGLLMGAYSFGAALMFRDLSWRNLLTPGGPHRRALGRHIFNSTIRFALLVWVPSLLWFCVARAMYLDETLAVVARDLFWNPKAAVVLSEVFAVYALAVLMRGLATWLKVFNLAVIAAVGFSALAISKFNFPTAISAGPTYIAILLTITVVAVLLADRVWTTRKLMPQML